MFVYVYISDKIVIHVKDGEGQKNDALVMKSFRAAFAVLGGGGKCWLRQNTWVFYAWLDEFP